jgi:dipeptidyl-peptidase-4
MKSTLSIVTVFLIITASFAQQKKLNLQDAVMEQYRSFFPEHLQQFSWRGNQNAYAYLKSYTQMVYASGIGKSDEKTLTISEVNGVLASKLKWFSGLAWKNTHAFYLSNDLNYYCYDLTTSNGKKLFSLPDTAENTDLNTQTAAVAFTIKNNLSYIDSSGKIISVTHNTNPNIVSGKTFAREEFGIQKGTFWSPKGNYLAFYQKDETYVADYPLLNITPTPGQLMSIKYPMAGQGSERPKVGIYNLKTQKIVFISPEGAVDDYLTNLVWTPDENYVLIATLNRDQNHMKLKRYDAQTGKLVNTVYEESNEKWVEPEHPAFFFSNSSDAFVWISEKDGYDNLYLMSASKGLLKQLTQNKWVVKEIVGSNEMGSEIYFYGTGNSPLETKLFAVNVKTGAQTCLTPSSGTHEAKVSPDGKFVFDQYSAHDIPNIAQILSNKAKPVKALIHAENTLANYTLGTTHIGKLKSSDGFDLYTRTIYPSNFDSSKRYPVLVYVYGGPHVQLITNSWYDGASLWMNWMAEQGYIVFTLDGRGSGNRGFAFENVIHRNLGTHELEDQLTGVRFLKSLPYVDSTRLAIHGWSFGGFMTTSMMLRNPGVFTTAVAGGPVTDWKYYEVMYGERYMDRPEQNPNGYAAASLLNKTQNLKGNLLLIHGSIDKTVVMQHNYALLKSFIDQQIQVDFFVYPMHEHNVRGIDRVHLMTKVLNYVLEHNQ